MLLPEKLDSDEPFWQQAAIRFISMLIAFVCEALPEEEQNMKSVVELHHQFLSGPGENLLLNWSIEHPEMYSSRKFVSISATKSAEKMCSSIQEFVNLGLEPFDNIEFEKIFCAEKTIDFHMMSRQKTACFCNVSDHDRSYSVLANIFYAQLLQTLIDDADRMPGGMLPIQTRLFFDDFAGAGPLPDFDNQVSIIRSRNIAVSIMIQSLSQLDSAYGKARAKSILNNFDTILFLGTNDLESSEFIANHINTLPYTVLNLPVDKAVLITRGKKPRIVDKIMPQNELTGLSM
jgi:type IV secretion system protein VirD4